MADVSEYKGISEAANDFQELITTAIRDLCHAYLALSDRGSVNACVGTLVAARAAIYAARDEPMPRLQTKSTGISAESLRRTIASTVSYAQQVERLFKEVDDDGVPDNISRWLDTRGKELIAGLTYLIGDLLTERNLFIIMNKLNPPG